MDDRAAIAALVSDLHWQIDQLKPRGIKDSAGNPYNPSYYKRGLDNAIERGGTAVPDYVRGYLYKTPSDGYKKLEVADSLDLACEALVADPGKPYAHLFSDADREAAQRRLAPHIAAIERRKAKHRAHIQGLRRGLPGDPAELERLAMSAEGPEAAIAINSAILDATPGSTAALNRIGRAHEALGDLEQAAAAFRRVLAIDARNAIAARRLRDVTRRLEQRRSGAPATARS